MKRESHDLFVVKSAPVIILWSRFFPRNVKTAIPALMYIILITQLHFKNIE